MNLSGLEKYEEENSKQSKPQSPAKLSSRRGLKYKPVRLVQQPFGQKALQEDVPLKTLSPPKNIHKKQDQERKNMIKQQMKAKQLLVTDIKQQIEFDISQGLLEQTNEDLFGSMSGASYTTSRFDPRHRTGFFSQRNYDRARATAESGPKGDADQYFEPEIKNQTSKNKDGAASMQDGGPSCLSGQSTEVVASQKAQNDNRIVRQHQREAKLRNSEVMSAKSYF